MPTSDDPTADPNEELGVQGDEGSGTESDEGTDQATLQSIVESFNDTQKTLLVSNATSETGLPANLSTPFENATLAIPEKLMLLSNKNNCPSMKQYQQRMRLSAPVTGNETGQVCADGTLPDVNGLCLDGNPPPPSLAENMTQSPVTGNETGQVCADGDFT